LEHAADAVEQIAVPAAIARSVVGAMAARIATAVAAIAEVQLRPLERVAAGFMTTGFMTADFMTAGLRAGSIATVALEQTANPIAKRWPAVATASAAA